MFVEPRIFICIVDAVDFAKSIKWFGCGGRTNSLELSPFSDALFILLQQTQKQAERFNCIG